MVSLTRVGGLLTTAALALAACSSSGPGAAAPTVPSTTPTPRPATTSEPTDGSEDTPRAVDTSPPAVDPDPSPLPEGSAQPLAWSACGDNLECGQLDVPLDYADPTGPRLLLDVIRRPAAATEGRLGSIVVNPGGPGGSGVEFVRQGVPLPSEVTERFDLVGWDPRGVGSTAPDCGGSLWTFYASDSDPDNPEEIESLENLAEAVADECSEAAGPPLGSLSTTATVHDLELLRQALDEPLNYVGFSYGTRIGLLYADIYGNRTRSMALIAVVDPALDFESLLAGQASAAEDALARMLGSCDAVAGCGLDDPVAAYADLAADVDSGVFAAEGLGPAQLADATLGAMYDHSRWGEFLSALEAGLTGDAAPMLERVADYFGTGELFLPYTAISCLQTDPPDAAGYREFAADLETLSPTLGADIANELLPCAFWAATPVDEALTVEAPDAPPIMLVASTGDAITPIEWTDSVAARLTEPVVVLKSGEGHLGITRSPCVARALTDYLVDGAAIGDTLDCED